MRNKDVLIGATKKRPAWYDTTYDAMKGLSKMQSDLVAIQRNLDAHTSNTIKTKGIEKAIDNVWKKIVEKLDPHV